MWGSQEDPGFKETDEIVNIDFLERQASNLLQWSRNQNKEVISESDLRKQLRKAG